MSCIRGPHQGGPRFGSLKSAESCAWRIRRQACSSARASFASCGVALSRGPRGRGSGGPRRGAGRYRQDEPAARRRRGDAARDGFICLRARATELERDFAYGCVRQLLEPTVARASASRPEAASSAAPPRSRARCSTPSAPAAARGRPRLLDAARPLLAAQQPRRRAPGRPRRRRHPLVRRRVAALLQLPRAAARRAAAGGARDHPQRRERHARPGPAGRRRPRRRCSARARSGRKRRATLCRARGSAPSSAPEFAAACREATGGNPFFLEALLREVAERGLPHRRGGARSVRAHRAGGRRRGASCCASPSGRPRRRRSCAPWPSSATARAWPRRRDWPRLPEEEAARAADLLISLAILAPRRGWSSRTRSCARRSTRTSARHERAAGARARGRDPGRRVARPRSGSPPSSPRPSRRATPSASRCCVASPRTRWCVARRWPPSLAGARAGRAAAGGRARRACCSS